MGWLDTVLGGALVLVGTVLVQVMESRRTQELRRDARQDASNDRRRTVLEDFCETAKTYRSALATQQDLANSGTEPPDTTRRDLREARMDYQALLYRVDPRLIEAFTAWEKGAISWANGDGSITQENTLWKNCMKLSGHRLRELDAA